MKQATGNASQWGMAVVLLILALLVSIAIRFYFPLTASMLEKMEWRALDTRFQIRGALPHSELKRISKRVAIIAMDDAATRRFGHPLSRSTHAQLVERLKSAGTKAIIFDVIFADPNRQNPQGDLQLARSIQKAGNVFLPFDHDSSEGSTESLLKKIEARLAYPIDAPATAHNINIQPPVESLFNAMRGGGHIASRRDSDGTFRSSILLMELGAIYPHTLLDAVARTEWKIDPHKQKPILDGEYLRLGERKIGPLQKRPLARSRYDAHSITSLRTGTAWAIPLNFLGGHDAMQLLTIPYIDVIEGRANDRLKNRIVIIGETATGTPDLRRSPFDLYDEFLGVETNATLIANLLDNNFLRYPPVAWGIVTACLMGLLAGGAALRFHPVLSFCVALGGLFFYACIATSYFINERLVLEMMAPFVAVALCYTTLTAFRLFMTDCLARDSQIALRETQTLLGQYVDEKLAKRLSDDPVLRRDMQIGTRREVTVLFSDIRSFTSWSEHQTPEEVKARLDEYFPVMCEIIADDYDGYVDKFIGDGLMAVWNGMSDQGDHARRAIRAALSMQRTLKLLNDGWEKQKQEPFRIGIGISSGNAIFGTFGSPNHKLMPTVLGDTVNLASRLEAMTKETGAQIIVSQSTYELVKDDFEFKPLGTVPVRGKMEAQPIYEVLGLIEGALNDTGSVRFL
jgi:adenylate cyclase